jgi:hypothetical protein
MNRRHLIKGALTLPLVSTVTSCRRSEENQPAAPSTGTLRVILQGPFAVVLDTKDNYHVTAFVPFDEPFGEDPNKPKCEHEFRFPSPLRVDGSEAGTCSSPGYRFSIATDGLETNRRRPRIDGGFYDFYLKHIGEEWKKTSKQAFVNIDLPAPDAITFFPPALPILFGGKPTQQPLNHVLEYQMTRPEAIYVNTGKEKQRPISCSELLNQYQEMWSKQPPKNAAYSQRPSIEEELKESPSSDLCFFFGVGLDPSQTAVNEEDHGVAFFNNVLLPAIAPRLGKKLSALGSCAEAPRNSSAMLMPAAFLYPESTPRLLEISSTVDCQAGGILASYP